MKMKTPKIVFPKDDNLRMERQNRPRLPAMAM
jgi:hypothetical protein